MIILNIVYQILHSLSKGYGWSKLNHESLSFLTSIIIYLRTKSLPFPPFIISDKVLVPLTRGTCQGKTLINYFCIFKNSQNNITCLKMLKRKMKTFYDLSVFLFFFGSHHGRRGLGYLVFQTLNLFPETGISMYGFTDETLRFGSIMKC